MRREPWPDFSVEISRRRWRCVPDPSLCLWLNGAAFLRELVPHAEVWMASEFLQVLDGFDMYEREPELLAAALGGGGSPDEICEALRLWLRLREETGARGGRLCWVRDSLREGSLPRGLQDSVLPHWEATAQALDERLSSAGDAGNPITVARRDAVALLAAIPGALLLTNHAPPPFREGAAGKPFSPSTAADDRSLLGYLESWGLPCKRLDLADDLVAL